MWNNITLAWLTHRPIRTIEADNPDINVEPNNPDISGEENNLNTNVETNNPDINGEANNPDINVEADNPNINAEANNPDINGETNNPDINVAQPCIAVDAPRSLLDSNTYKAVIKGNLQKIQIIVETEDQGWSSVLNKVTFEQNTFLHLVAIGGHSYIVDHIRDRRLLESVPQILLERNSKGNLALHIAAAAGHRSTVDSLIKWIQELAIDVFVVTNNVGETPLHLALKGNHASVALSLVEADQGRRACFILNDNVSPLCLAVEAGNPELVDLMLSGNPDINNFDWRPILKAAIRGKNLAILKSIAPRCLNLIISAEVEGRTPLSYAAFIRFDKGVDYLLTEVELLVPLPLVYIKDEDGSFPIHSACRSCNTSAVKMILQRHPDTIELLNDEGQTVIHVAAESGRANIVKYLLKKPYTDVIINQRDSEGNTALHLSTMNWHPRVVSLLLWDGRINLKTVNNRSFTALDECEEGMASVPSLLQWLTWMALVSAGTARASQPEASHQIHRTLDLQIYRDRVNTLVVVATVVATLSYAAGSAVPLGYNNKDFKSNVENPYEEVAFDAFVICNSIAVYSSVFSTIALIGTQVADIKCILITFKYVVPLLGNALVFMSFAFVASLYLVLGNRQWLSLFVLASGCFYLLALLFVVVPYIAPYTWNPFLFRYVLRYPFSFLAFFAEWKDSTERNVECLPMVQDQD